VSAGPVGVVLAGGAGRRMGGAKATVELGGRPLLLYPLDALGEVLKEVAVVCKEDTLLPALPPSVAIWCEADPRRHPLVGVVAALRTAAGRPVVVCAGDMPLVTADAIRALVAAPAAAAVVTSAGGRLQPLLARYSPDALALLEAMDPDEPATGVVERLGPLVVELADERIAFNVNAPEDLLLAEGEGVRRDARFGA
jgi:molybdenum cofactor guanylyltransferase